VRALVTGAAGFLGSHIVDACLARGDEVSALVRPSSDLSYLRTLPAVTLNRGDLSDVASLEQATRGVDVVYHSAARVLDYGSRRDFHEANVAGTARLLEAARKNGVRRFVFVSSPSVVGDGRDQLDVDESYPYPASFLNLYSETKAEAEKLVLQANGTGIVTCAVRPRAVWGQRDRHGYMPKILARLADRRMRDLSGGREIRASLCYCENAAQACVLAAVAPGAGGRAYFVTDREVVDVWEFMGTVARTFGVPAVGRKVSPAVLRIVVEIVHALWKVPVLGHRRPPPVSRYSVSLLTRSSTYDTSAARRDLGYEPRVTQSEGLERLRTWVESIGGVAEYVRDAR
jgi:nucleoside-diphosphate-sugar epimerase